jgi:tRNA threonylcarbamoyladenosine biosynthesis protein TsaB
VNARLLAFDTSTEAMAIAVQTTQHLLVWNGEGGAAASAQLLPQIRRMLQSLGLELRQLQAIAFGAGPGAFTGLRTACAVAQGLALGTGRPVVPVDTLLALAEDARAAAPLPPGSAVWAVLDARMGELYAAQYRWDGARWFVLDAPLLATPLALSARWAEAPPRFVAGRALEAFADRLDLHGAQALPQAEPRTAALLRVAAEQFAREGGTDPALALPLYVRDKVAQTTAEREAVASK